METIWVTGAAGFIGYHTCQALLSKGYRVVGIDNINDYYAVSLKHDRLDALRTHEKSESFEFYQLDIVNKSELLRLADDTHPKAIIHLAAQAGVRYSIENPQAYIDSNITGFLNVMECARQETVKHFVYASSSSVYGNTEEVPFNADGCASHPISMYAATKRSNELMANVFATQYGLPSTGLRFFTVYGPWGRPDMAPMKFAKAIANGQPIDVYNHGDHLRDFTYVDDIVEGILRVMAGPPQAGTGSNNSPSNSLAPHRVYNIGAQTPVHLMRFIETIEQQLGVVAEKNMLPMQMGDVRVTYADVEALVRDHGYRPSVSVDEGIQRFIAWFKEYYQNND